MTSTSGVLGHASAEWIADNKDDLLNKLFGLKSLDLTRKVIAEAYQRAEQGREKYLAEPTSAWGFGNGLTEVARDQEHADARVELERGGGEDLRDGVLACVRSSRRAAPSRS